MVFLLDILNQVVNGCFFFFRKKQSLIYCIIKVFIFPDSLRQSGIPEKVGVNEYDPSGTFYI